jgi:hypothetical protein
VRSFYALSINTQSLQLLQQNPGLVLDPQNQDPLDAFFTAIDFEHSHLFHEDWHGRVRLREVGFLTLDTRDIRYPITYLYQVKERGIYWHYRA